MGVQEKVGVLRGLEAMMRPRLGPSAGGFDEPSHFCD